MSLSVVERAVRTVQVTEQVSRRETTLRVLPRRYCSTCQVKTFHREDVCGVCSTVRLGR